MAPGHAELRRRGPAAGASARSLRKRRRQQKRGGWGGSGAGVGVGVGNTITSWQAAFFGLAQLGAEFVRQGFCRRMHPRTTCFARTWNPHYPGVAGFCPSTGPIPQFEPLSRRLGRCCGGFGPSCTPVPPSEPPNPHQNKPQKWVVSSPSPELGSIPSRGFSADPMGSIHVGSPSRVHRPIEGALGAQGLRGHGLRQVQPPGLAAIRSHAAGHPRPQGRPSGSSKRPCSFRNQPFSPGAWRFSGKKDPWKEWER